MRRSVLGAIPIVLLTAFVCLIKPVDARAASSVQILYTFQGGTDGAYPYSDLTLDAAGNLYGTTAEGGQNGCGTVFRLAPTKDGWKHLALYSFRGFLDGCYPDAGLVFDGSGNLYGTTRNGGGSGNYGCGTVFKLAIGPQGGVKESVLYSFSCTGGSGTYPEADLVFDNQGNLYGTTSAGGTGNASFCGFAGCGTAFELSPGPDGSWTETTIHDFQGSPDAATPVGALVPDSKGGFYGASEYGGPGACSPLHSQFGPPAGCSAVFELTPSGEGWTETVIYGFFRGLGFARNPTGGFIVGGAGLLFGTSSNGGNDIGTFFQLEQTGTGWNQSILHRFYDTPDAAWPFGRLVTGPRGAWIGLTTLGGANGNGTIFALEQTNQGWKNRILYSFDSSIGYLKSGPAVDSQGHVYGTALENLDAYGEIYEVLP